MFMAGSMILMFLSLELARRKYFISRFQNN
jgi:hypothetical protein